MPNQQHAKEGLLSDANNFFGVPSKLISKKVKTVHYDLLTLAGPYWASPGAKGQ